MGSACVAALVCVSLWVWTRFRYQRSVHTSVAPVFPLVIISLPDKMHHDDDDDVVCMAADTKGKEGT
jgi:hypothetical protein